MPTQRFRLYAPKVKDPILEAFHQHLVTCPKCIANATSKGEKYAMYPSPDCEEGKLTQRNAGLRIQERAQPILRRRKRLKMAKRIVLLTVALGWACALPLIINGLFNGQHILFGLSMIVLANFYAVIFYFNWK